MSDKIVLTDRALKAIRAAPVGKRTMTWDAVQPHLGIRVTERGAKSFVVVKRLTGVRAPVVHVLGSYPIISLAEARTRARMVLSEIAEGIDPKKRQIAQEEERRQHEKDTFAAIAKLFVAKHASKNRKGNETQRIINVYLAPKFGDRAIGSIRRREIAELLDAIEERKYIDKRGRKLGGPVMADHVLAALRKLMNWHAARDDDFVSPIVRGMARTKPKERAGVRVLADDEIRALWIALDNMTDDDAQERHEANDIFAALVRCLLLTGQRREEVGRLARTEIDADKNWTIPAERNKTKVAKIVPLTDVVQEHIASLDRTSNSDFVFTTNGETPFSGYSKCKSRLDAAMLEQLKEVAAERRDKAALAKLVDIEIWLRAARKGDRAAREKLKRAWWKLHDLRRTAKTLMARAGVRPDISERVLGHVIGGVEGVYDRYEYVDEKRDALSRLATSIGQIIRA